MKTRNSARATLERLAKAMRRRPSASERTPDLSPPLPCHGNPIAAGAARRPWRGREPSLVTAPENKAIAVTPENRVCDTALNRSRMRP